VGSILVDHKKTAFYKMKNIKFFSPDDNQSNTVKPQIEKSLPTGRISSSGKIVFPAALLEELAIDVNIQFQVGTDQGKRKIKNLYLVPTSQEAGFGLVRIGRGYSLPLELILSKGGINYATEDHIFTASIFLYEGAPAYKLAIQTKEPKPPYTGKPRGRKPKAENPDETQQ